MLYSILTLQLLFPVIGLSALAPRICNGGSSPYTYKTEYFDVPVDHFAFTNDDMFRMRYLINDSYWKPNEGAPIFFYTGNEGDIESFAANTGFLWESAPEFHALIVFAEHRYYGHSMPYGNKSLSEPKYSGYLTAEQTLADYVYLLTNLTTSARDLRTDIFVNGKKNVNKRTKRIPIISFGGSYGGMLSAWFRMKYPGLVTGALASSAPIWQFPGLNDCHTFARIVTSAFEIEEKSCPHNVRKLWTAIDELGNSKEGLEWMSTNWKLCNALKNKTDVDNMKAWISSATINVAMVNYPYPANFLGDLPGHPVRAFCKHLDEPMEGKDLLTATFKGLNAWFNHSGSAKCFNLSSEFGTSDLGLDAWNYQSCTEMVMPICMDGKQDFFEPAPWDLGAYVNDCKKTLKMSTRPYSIPKLFGGKNLETASNIIFSNGLLDPWAGGGVLKNVSESTVAVLLPSAAHHLDLRASNNLDPPTVTMARKFYKKIFRKWIADFHKQ
ncbi:lysosomal Pro-X carboxypeptidase isoform X1 [Nilaparvata lugens]|uniref:Lysosomal Pro-X carboxypeptidase n=1 Tax=Nilaparvata lugens TaxID=108931 RepID=A0A1I9WL54_NILLU|nr:lysosomal Pro-X carboxypeptidase isoform X2 [Nilaparvata lugens]XP_039294371.1 lysosomal Pro-X carboxypeptidase isoform X1 [Nilaparvata lugens]APA33874.1 seminal fluid protein [Nilaparvata lugens]